MVLSSLYIALPMGIKRWPSSSFFFFIFISTSTHSLTYHLDITTDTHSHLQNKLCASDTFLFLFSVNPWAWILPEVVQVSGEGRIKNTRYSGHAGHG
jgi:hypothetical protein